MLCTWIAATLLSKVVLTTPLQYGTSLEQREVSSPCQDLALAQADYVAKFPEKDISNLPANLTYACLTSVPVQQNFSLQLLNNMKAWFEIQSDIDYVAEPPSGSLWQPMDLFAYMDRISDDIESGNYESQYDIETDIFALSLHFHDFHTLILPGLFMAGKFSRGFELVSYSVDGLSVPKVFFSTDAIVPGEYGFETRQDLSKTSSVVEINGIPVQEFLQTAALVSAFSHDPDTMYNDMLFTGSNSLRSSFFYPGSETTLKFENGTEFSIPTISAIEFDLSNTTSGQEFWETHILEADAVSSVVATAVNLRQELSITLAATTESGFHEPTTTTTATAAVERRQEELVEEEGPSITQLPQHPPPVYIDNEGKLSGYYLEGYDDVAVLRISSFDSEQNSFLIDFQETLAAFLADCQAAHKTKLIIDVFGNGGGYVDLGTELLAQLFPNIPPDQKSNMRASLSLQILLEKEGSYLDRMIELYGDDYGSLTVEGASMFAWQSLMTADGHAFTSLDDMHGPNKLSGDGEYTAFFQSNYTNNAPSDWDQGRIWITGYGDRVLDADTPPPFDASNIVFLTDGLCGSTCAVVHELLTNAHSVPSFVVGGRPTTGPMQAVGNTKGSQAFGDGVLQWFLAMWESDILDPLDPDRIKGTVFEGMDLDGIMYGITGLNGKNNYRIGDDTETPLQMVYEAADCRIWPTIDMLVDQSAIWKRVVDIAFDLERKDFGAGGGPYTSKYCVKGSTGHSTSVTGGLQHGELGNQDPPKNAYPQFMGWIKDGNQIVQGFSPIRTDDGKLSKGKPTIGKTDNNTNTDSDLDEERPRLSDEQVKVGLANLKTLCGGYSGNKWLLMALCGVFG